MGFSLKKIGQRISQVYDQANFADGGRTYQQRTPTKTGSVGHQLTHNGATNLVGNTFVKPAIRVPINVSNVLYNNAVAPVIGTPHLTPQQVQPISGVSKFTGATGSLAQTAGDIIQTGSNLAMPGSSTIVKNAFRSVAPKLVPDIALRAVANSGVGAVGGAVNNVGAGLSNNQIHSVNDFKNQALTGAKFGAVLGGGGTLAAPLVKAGGRVALKGSQQGAQKVASTMDTPAVQSLKATREASLKEFHATKSPKVAQSHLDNINSIDQQIKDLQNKGGGQPFDNKFGRALTGEKPVIQQGFDPVAYAKEQSVKQDVAAKGQKSLSVRGDVATAKTKAIDALSAIEDPVAKQLGREGALPLRNALDRSLRSRTIAGQFAQDNGIHDIIKSVKNPKQFDQYVIAKHAADLEAQGVNTGRNLAKDQQLIQAFAGKYEPQAQALTAYNHKLLDEATNSGLISKETNQYLKEKYPNYVPMNRVFSEEELNAIHGNGAGPASLSTQTVVQRINGSSREVASPLESVLSKTHDVIAQGERNSAARILASHESLPGNPLGLRELAPGETIGVKPTISFFDNGVKRTFETTQEVANAAKSLNKEQLGFVGQLFAVPTRILRLGATSANPAFALANVAKDTASAFINSEHSLRSSLANPPVFLKALSATFHHGGANYKELVREGAGGTSYDIARNAVQKSFKEIRAERNVGTKALYKVTHPGELLRAVEDTIGRSEEYSRAMQYYGNKSAALAKGKGEAYARMYGADAARNNTVNFARAGEYGRVLNTVLPYLNAGVQGSRTLVRNLKNRPVQTTSKIVITAFLPVAATTAWNLGSPERKAAYDSISDYEKENNIIIVPPNPKQDEHGRWNVIKIPTSQEIANLNNVVRNGVESLSKDKNFDFKAMAGNLAGTATSINAQSGRQVIGQVTPQAVKPFAETALNQNLFTGQQIVPDSQKNLANKDQTNNQTSGTARVIGRLTDKSPLKIDNAIKTLTGGGGQNIINATDTALAKAGVINKDQVRGKSVPESILNRFNSAQGLSPGAQYFTNLQDTAKKVKLVGKDYELLNAITTKEIDGNGKAIPTNDKDALNLNQILANNPKVAAVRAQAAVNLAKKTGKPVDPLYKLTPEQQQAYYTQQGSIYKGQQYERVAKENQDWLPTFQKERTAYFDSLHLKSPTVSGKVKYPLSSSEQDMVDKYFAITDPTQRSQAIENNPKISDAFNKLSKYANDKQIAQGSAPLDSYPQSDPQVQQWTKEYFAQPKGSKMKWQRANPGKWQSVSQQLTAQSLYGLEGDVVQAQYKDTGLSQKGLKDLYTLGQYDVQKTTDANGNTFYALGSGGGSSSGSGGRSSVGGSSATYGTLNPNKYNVSLKSGGSAPKSTKVAKVSKNLKYKVALKSTPAKISVKKSRV